MAARFQEWGLEPAGRAGTYFHEHPMLVTVERGGAMELLDGPLGRVPYLYGDDFSLATNSGSGDVRAEVVVVGHGLSSAARDLEQAGLW